MKARVRFATGVVALVLGSGTVGCSPEPPSYSTHDITATNAPMGGAFRLEGSQVPLGGVLQAKIVARDSDGARMRTAVRSEQPELVEVLLIDGVADTYLVLGRHTGQTTIDLLANDQVVRRVPVTVIAVTP